MKVSTGLFTLLLASQVLPCAMRPVHAQAANARTAQIEDESDGRRMQLDYEWVNRYASGKLAYSFEEVTEKNQSYADGNQVTSKVSSMRYRDQKGRVRIVYKSFRGNERIFIADPNARLAYLVRPERKDILRIKGEPPMYRASPDFSSRPTQAPDWSRQVTTSLGLKDFAGVKAAGTLTEIFYPAGARGNEKEMVETNETWRANELSGTVYSRRFTPREGETIVRIENLKFGDVPESMFAVPSAYPIRDLVLNAPQSEQ
jgi:hypothetical protein